MLMAIININVNLEFGVKVEPIDSLCFNIDFAFRVATRVGVDVHVNVDGDIIVEVDMDVVAEKVLRRAAHGSQEAERQLKQKEREVEELNEAKRFAEQAKQFAEQEKQRATKEENRRPSRSAVSTGPKTAS